MVPLEKRPSLVFLPISCSLSRTRCDKASQQCAGFDLPRVCAPAAQFVQFLCRCAGPCDFVPRQYKRACACPPLGIVYKLTSGNGDLMGRSSEKKAGTLSAEKMVRAMADAGYCLCYASLTGRGERVYAFVSVSRSTLHSMDNASFAFSTISWPESRICISRYPYRTFFGSYLIPSTEGNRLTPFWGMSHLIYYNLSAGYGQFLTSSF